jgi:hypothetical protein
VLVLRGNRDRGQRLQGLALSTSSEEEEARSREREEK